MSPVPRQTVFARRLREVREATDFSQRRLGIAAGIDPFVASTRINRYERGVSWPDVSIILKLAEVLGVPAATFITDDKRLAEVIVLFARASRRKQDAVLKVLQGTKQKSASAKQSAVHGERLDRRDAAKPH